MKKLLLVSLMVLSFAGVCLADDREKDIERLQTAGQVLDEIMSAPDSGVPQQVMDSAECVAVVPSMFKGGFVFGGALGKGVVTCRTPNGWSAPAFFRIEGGSFGFQIGGQAVDLVMLVMNQRGMQSLLASHVKLGADASAAAGPVGRLAEGMTDISMRSEILTYSRARGLFAGVSLNGAVVKQHKDDTRAFYGRMIPFRTLLTGGVESPSEAQPFLGAVAKYNKGKSDSNAPVTATSVPASTSTTSAATVTTTTGATAAQPAAQAQPATNATASSESSSQEKPDPTAPKTR
ncbi:MAG TPA: lipid-binding SYLF domain-containing protein [Terriglobales bacterium]|nr:lipid-binding SYLF domain-containing protein [Terriglobales bacterium]